MYRLRPLTPADIPRLSEINPTFTAHSVLKILPCGTPPFRGWQITEIPLEMPFEKVDRYDFNQQERNNIQARSKKAGALILLVENTHTGQLVGILDVENEAWRQTGWIWNLMLDVSARGQGLGRQLVHQAVEWGRQHKLRALLLETQSNNTPACHFYIRMGFQLVGINVIQYTNHDIEDDEVALFWGYNL